MVMPMMMMTVSVVVIVIVHGFNSDPLWYREAVATAKEFGGGLAA